MIRPDGSSVEKDHPSSINTGRTMNKLSVCLVTRPAFKPFL